MYSIKFIQLNNMKILFICLLLALSCITLSQAIEQSQTSDIQTNNQNEQKKQEPQAQPDKQQQEKEEHHVNIPGVGLSIVFIFTGLIYGALLKLFSRVTTIPYNPLLLVSGIALGMNYDHLGILGQSIKLVSQAQPNGILAIFLPCLVFESAFKTQWHVFKKLAGQSLILGIPSSILGACMITLCIKFLIFPGDTFTWHQAFLFSSILTCTDIFSFVIKLKRCGTPLKLTSLIQGESLFNYCTCVLIYQFTQYYNSTKDSQDISFLSYVKLFGVQTFGGVLFGVIFGFVAVYIIKRMIYDGILVVTLMTIFCYSNYLIAQFSTLQVSGIVSIVAYALYMNANAKTWLFGQTGEFVSCFWGYLVFVAETSIFIIAGVLVGANTSKFQSLINLESEYIIAVYIYLIVLICRFLQIGIFIKYLRALGEGMTWKEVIVITFAGLKGAIGISLAMMVFKNNNQSQIVSCLILVHVTANSLFTLVIHGLSIGLIVKALGVSVLKKVQYKFFHEYLTDFQNQIIDKKEELRETKDRDSFAMVDWEDVDNQAGIQNYRQFQKEIDDLLSKNQFTQESKFEKRHMYKLEQVLKEFNNQSQGQGKQQTKDDLKFDFEVEFRKRFLKDLIAKYWEYHDRNYTTPAALMLLIQSAVADLDTETQQMESWNWIKNQITFIIKAYSEFMKLTFLNELAKTHLFEYVSFCFDVVSSYIQANEQVRNDFIKSFKFNSTKSISNTVLKQSEQNQKEAEFFLTNYLEPSFPEIQKEVKTRKVSFYILHSFKGIIDRNNENGQLEPNEFDLLNNIIGQKSLELNLYSPKWEETDFFEILKENEFFGILPEPVIKVLACELGDSVTFDANQKIVDNGQIAKYVFIVKKGGVGVEFTNESLVYKQVMLKGQIFGYQSLLTNIHHSKSTANTMAEIIQIKKIAIAKIFQTFPKLQESFWKKNIFQCYKMFVRKDDITFRISHLLQQQLTDMISHFELVRYEQGVHDSSRDMIFIRGDIQIEDDQEFQIYPFMFISREDELSIKVKSTSFFLIGQLDYEIFEKSNLRVSKQSKKLRKMTTMNA